MAVLRDLSAARDALGLDLAALQSRTGFYWAYARNLERGRTRAGADTIWGAWLIRPTAGSAPR
jgi:hypothetical protein